MSDAKRIYWRDPALGTAEELLLPSGTLRYFDAGQSSPIVFVHGVLVNANLWRKVVPSLANEFRCVSLDLPLGSHQLPMPQVRLDPPALADLVADVIDRLDLHDVTLVGNDTGGALCQLVVTTRPYRVGRLVLTSSDYRDNFPPKLFRFLKLVGRAPTLARFALAPMRIPAIRRLPIGFGWLTKRPIDRAAEDSYLLPALTNPAIRADFSRLIANVHPRYTNHAADRLGQFKKPALIAWSREDRLFPPAHARQLAAELPSAELAWIDDSYTFSAEDQPQRLAELIADFARR